MATTAVTAAPCLSLIALALLAWVLRSCSLAAEAVRARRRQRGAQWYDGPLLLLHAPWRIVQALPGTLLLLAWSLGVTAAAGLICYAAGTTLGTAVAACGVVLAASSWWGPGGSRVRGPATRVLAPAARTAGWWMLVGGTLLVVGLVLGILAQSHGAVWAPFSRAPFGTHHR